MSEVSWRPEGTEPSTICCFCDSCDRVLYVDAESRYCPVCSSPVVEVTPKDQISLPDTTEAPSA